MPVQHIIVSEAEAGQKLLQFLQRRLGREVPQSFLLRIIRKGEVRVNKGRKAPFDRIEAGDDVRIPPVSGAAERPSATSNVLPNVSPYAAQTPPAKNAAQHHASTSAGTGTGGGLNVLAETSDLLVLNKPAGLPVQTGSGHRDAVTTRLEHLYAGADFMPTPAHRLDKNTSGLLLVAKSYAMLRTLHELFRREEVECDGAGGVNSVGGTNGANSVHVAHGGKFVVGGGLQKIYVAWVRGDWQMPSGKEERLEDIIAKIDENGQEKMRRVASAPLPSAVKKGITPAAQNAFLPVLDEKTTPQGRYASCVVRRLCYKNGATLLCIRLETGRTHQIRVQLALRGHPIIGDSKYGNSAPRTKMRTGAQNEERNFLRAEKSGLLLHAASITLPDGEQYFCPAPWTGKWAFDVSLLHTV